MDWNKDMVRSYQELELLHMKDNLKMDYRMEKVLHQMHKDNLNKEIGLKELIDYWFKNEWLNDY